MPCGITDFLERDLIWWVSIAFKDGYVTWLTLFFILLAELYALHYYSVECVELMTDLEQTNQTRTDCGQPDPKFLCLGLTVLFRNV